MTDVHDTRKVVVVTGDQTMDWNLARPQSFADTGLSWSTSDAIRGYGLQGGAALLAELIRNLAKQIDPGGERFEILPASARTDGFSPEDTQYHHSYALWSLFNYEENAKPAKSETHVWRVKEFLGLQRPAIETKEIVEEWKRLAGEIRRASLVVLDDAGLGFRDHPEVWSEALAASDHLQWIILKLARPVARGALWEYLSENFAQRLIVVIPVNDLRLTQAKISRELSWERTAEDLAWELTYSPEVGSLSKCAHVIVSFDGAGALLLSNQSATQSEVAGRDFTLFFDQQAMEGMWAQNQKGGMIGYTSCLVSSIAREVLLSGDAPDIRRGVQNGLSAIQTLHQEGYGKQEPGEPVPPLVFPTQRIIEQIATDSSLFVTATVPGPNGAGVESESISAGCGMSGTWTILQQRCTATAGRQPLDRYQLAQEIVRKGLKATLNDVPLGQFGDLLTVDRREIEGYRSIGSLIREYLAQEKPERPLSIAVFGEPGSGKSFGISEVAKSVLPNRIKKLTFNLSQFSDADEMLGALHQVRDVALSGEVPLVFWDEFDTTLSGQQLGWLRYFLSPMQDGTFQEGEITHPIGQSIFVFAGGTSPSHEKFGKNLKAEEFELAKVRDFLSRLKGHLHVLGPNPTGKEAASDPDFVIRRAILLRSFLERSALQVFLPRHRKGVADIDNGVLRAFLKAPSYKHGARSMESIVAMSVLAGKNRFERSSLPAEEQLDLHVNGQAFLALVQQIEFDQEGKILERLAEKAHDVYRAGVKGAEDETLPHAEQPYAQLPVEIKEQNRDQVRDIQAKLDLTGYVMIPARIADREFTFPPDDIELLAEHEHNRWMELKVRNGWRYAPDRNDKAKLHPDLLPWRSKLVDEEQRILYSAAVCEAIGSDELSEGAKEKDRIAVRGIPHILARAGFTIVKVRA